MFCLSQRGMLGGAGQDSPRGRPTLGGDPRGNVIVTERIDCKKKEHDELLERKNIHIFIIKIEK